MLHLVGFLLTFIYKSENVQAKEKRFGFLKSLKE